MIKNILIYTIFIVIFIVLFCFCGFIYSSKESVTDWGVVVDKYRKDANTTTVVVGRVPTTTYHAEEWHIVMVTENSDKLDAEVSRKDYRLVGIGSRITFSYTKFLIVGGMSDITILEIE